MPAREGENQKGISEDDLQGKDPRVYYKVRKRFYQDQAIAAGYDSHRFEGATRSRRNDAEWRVISRALDRAEGTRELLDLPTGTGRWVARFLERGLEVVGADISREMMARALSKTGGTPPPGLAGYVQADAEALPFRDGSFDCASSFRFFFHLPEDVRRRALAELGRVSRRWVLVDYRHRYALRNILKRWAHSLGLRGPAPVRISRAELDADIAHAGLKLVEIFPVARVFSDKWIVLMEKR